MVNTYQCPICKCIGCIGGLWEDIFEVIENIRGELTKGDWYKHQEIYKFNIIICKKCGVIFEKEIFEQKWKISKEVENDD